MLNIWWTERNADMLNWKECWTYERSERNAEHMNWKECWYDELKGMLNKSKDKQNQRKSFMDTLTTKHLLL